MKKYIKTIGYVLSFLTIGTSFAADIAKETKPQRSIMLWGTRHEVMSFASDDECTKQKEVVYNAITKQPELIEIALPNFIFGVESIAPTETDKHIFAADDLSIKVYVGLYMHAGLGINQLKDLLTKDGDREVTERFLVELIGNFYGFFLTEEIHGEPLVAQITKSIINRDRSLPYFQNISGDIDLVLNLDNPTITLGPGALLLLKHYSKSGNRDEMQAKLPEILNSYLTFSRNIATEYFNQRIQPFAKKYNINVDYPGSTYNGKPIFSVASPDSIFSSNHMLGDFETESRHIQNLVSLTWRDHFMAENMIDLIKNKNKPTANILFWFGEDHMPGITRHFMLSTRLTLDEKKSILTATQTHNSSVACDANKVVDSMIQKPRGDNEPRPNALNEWYISYGLKDPTHKITVYALNGKQVYSEPAFSSSISRRSVESSAQQSLQSKNSEPGVYFVHVQTSTNKDIDLYKILLRN